MNLAEKYVIEALDNYPYNLTTVIESLDYALSYDEDNAMAYCLLGQLYKEQFQNYDKALEYLERALSLDKNCFRAYYQYIDALIKVEDFKKAAKIIDYALKQKGINKSWLWCNKAIIQEYHKRYRRALNMLKSARVFAVEDFQINYIGEIEARISAKLLQKK